MEQTKINVALYTRVCSSNQDNTIDALKKQEESLRKYCEEKGYNVLGVYRDNGASGANFNRPAWKRLDFDIMVKKEPVSMVLFTQWTRLSRNIKNIEKVLDKYSSKGIELNAIEQPIDMTIPIPLCSLFLWDYLDMREDTQLPF